MSANTQDKLINVGGSGVASVEVANNKPFVLLAVSMYSRVKALRSKLLHTMWK
jgi:hypothetical protein